MVCGSFSGTVDFDPTSAINNRTANGTDGFVAYYNGGGELLWIHTTNESGNEEFSAGIINYGSAYTRRFTGVVVKGGNLFTTASPCELCSKKAFQLGIKHVYYIDPYPGIAGKHILKSGVNPENNPKVLMFQGAVGRAFHKLYEPFMAYKDELKILTELEPKTRV